MTPVPGNAAEPAWTGLSSAEAAMRLRRDGPNTIHTAAGHSAAALLVRQFRNPLVLILVIAAVVSGMVQQWMEAGIILAIVLGSTLLGFAQEYRASAAVEALQKRLALNARVRRDGEIRSVAFAEVVVGDHILLSAGAVVPADAVVLEAVDLLVSEAALTGESFPVEKRPGATGATDPTAEQTVFLGTSVRSGTGEAMVLHTGLGTRYGAIAARLNARPVETDFARGVRRFGEMLIRVMLVVVVLVLIANQLLGRPFLDSLLFSVALGVGLSPELLPAVVAVTLSAGARDLARNGVILRRLEAMEDLGGMTVFCTDKTGTLTEGDIVLTACLDPAGRDSVAVRRLAFVNAAFETGIENPLDQAVVAAGQKAGLTTTGFTKVDEIPYDFIRRRLSIVVETDAPASERQMISKGAFEAVLAQCATVVEDAAEAPLTPARRDALEAWYRARGEEGLRVLAVATRRLAPRSDYGRADEAEMRFEGFLTFMDPPKAEAAQAIADLAALGVAVKVLSGDNRHVVAHVARALGLASDALLTGADIAALKDEALWVQVERTVLFAEVDPQQKERIVHALQRRGQSVGYLGDGINDAPALSAADVGVSVEQAVDVARESADVILLKRDLGVLKRGVEGGRRTFANTLKYLSITISGNFGNMVSMALATPFLPFLPLLAEQILLNNFLSSLPSMAISSDAVDPEQIQVAQRIQASDIQRYMLVFGLISSPFDLITFVLLLQVFHAPQSLFQTAWFVMSLLTELAVVMVLRTRGRAWRSRPGRWLVWTSLAVAIVAVAAPYLGPVSRLFGFAPLPPLLMAAMLGLVCAYVAATETAKAWFFRDVRRRAARPPPGARTRAPLIAVAWRNAPIASAAHPRSARPAIRDNNTMRHREFHRVERVGWMRAAVLGANDGLVSTASLIVGVAAAASGQGPVLIAGIAGLVAGAMSMAAGEYVSVSSQSDTEKADLARETSELAGNHEAEVRELAGIYTDRGVEPDLATQVAQQMMAHDALGAHARDELGISEITTARPVQAALTSAATFSAGAALPLAVAAVAPMQDIVLWVAGCALVGLGLLGALGAKAGGAPVGRSMIRVVFWGALAMAITAGVGRLFGVAA